MVIFLREILIKSNYAEKSMFSKGSKIITVAIGITATLAFHLYDTQY
jgi:hypothetical protein